MKPSIQPGDQIRMLREARRFSQPQLAARASVSRAHLWHLEKNHMTPGLVTLEKIAAALDVGLSRFFIQPDRLLLEDSLFKKSNHFCVVLIRNNVNFCFERCTRLPKPKGHCEKP